ncbi:MAG: hypothetical protein K2J76_09535 [Oscillospiraceae bacterium]|nr:hypothetical protein [Oscillospiraceae bacterium]
MAKKKKIHLLCIILPVIAIVLAAITFVVVHGVRVTKTWRTFSEKRVEKLEDIFNADFPDDAEFEYYSDKFRIPGGGHNIHTLYIKNIVDPESFCRNNFDTSVSFTFMADIKNAEVIENKIFSERGAEEFLKWGKESWIKEERSVDFLCRAINQISEHSYDYVEIYFFSNDMGSYDVKLKAEHCGER